MSEERRKPYNSDTMTAEQLLSSSPFEGDLDAELAARPGRRPASKLTLGLAACVLLVAGVLIGIQAQKAVGGSSGGDRQALIQAFANGQGQRGGGFGQGGQGGGGFGQGGAGRAGGATVGTVKLVDGKKIYVQATDGSTVTVTTDDDTDIRVAKKGRIGDLKPGSTVVVQGSRGADGTVAATAVNEGGGMTPRGGGGR
ncbi:hypothetical protein Misp01_70340 [Microtetraspora sp. NBRC 13810]|uniref:hypothetical protein n=1 Tax=Microtetraspora sp. NBRC 13810 TaxID=3030990 RepID=UPI0024A18869|nr:hypothetical protein [Microtetraspora sp. NBRC 13810]GLW11906.1 hypothetical protein Misp01_70340 [Microtetraspora sp. NBRC 13810]